MNDRASAGRLFDPAAYQRPEPESRHAARAADTAKAVDNVALLPALSDPYKAAGTADNTEVSRLVLVMGKDGFLSGQTAYIAFQYVHLSMGEFGFTTDGQWFSFIVSDLQPKLVTVHGRNVLKIFDQISLRRIPWIRQADRDFRAGNGVGSTEPVITRLKVEDWKRKPEQAAKLAEALELREA